MRYKHEDTPNTPSEAINGLDASVTRENAFELGLPRQFTIITKTPHDIVSWIAAEDQSMSFADFFKGSKQNITGLENKVLSVKREIDRGQEEGTSRIGYSCYAEICAVA